MQRKLNRWGCHFQDNMHINRLHHLQKDFNIYRCFLISTWNQTDFQTHFAPILDLLPDCFDCEQVETK